MGPKFSRLLLAMFALSVSAVNTSVAHAQTSANPTSLTYKVIPLGTWVADLNNPASPVISWVSGINNSNIIAATYSNNGTTAINYWRPNKDQAGKVTGYNQTPTGQLLGKGMSSTVRGISNVMPGIAGDQFFLVFATPGSQIGGVWRSDTGATHSIGSLWTYVNGVKTTTHTNQSESYAVNASGLAAGASAVSYVISGPGGGGGSGAPHAITSAWTATDPTDLVPNDGTNGSLGYVINDSGVVAGFNTPTYRALRWSPPSYNKVDLGPGQVWAINSEGDCAGRDQSVNAVCWLSGTTTKDIIMSGTTSSYADAHGIRDRMGATYPPIVGTGVFSGVRKAFCYDNVGGLVALNARLDAVSLAAGWNILDARGISKDNVIIAHAAQGSVGYIVALVPTP